MKSHTQHIKANAWQKTNIHEHNINTKKQHKPWNWIEVFLLLIQSIHGCSPQVLCSALLALNDNSELYNNTKEGAYIPFALSNSSTIKSTINSYLRALNLINVFLSTIQYKCASLHQLINAWPNKYQGVSKLCESAVQLFFLFHALARLMSERCSCINLHFWSLHPFHFNENSIFSCLSFDKAVKLAMLERC
jgi:hypothetical protein